MCVNVHPLSVLRLLSRIIFNAQFQKGVSTLKKRRTIRLKKARRGVVRLKKGVRVARSRRANLKRGSRLGHHSLSYNKAYDSGFDEAYNEGFNIGYNGGLEAGHQEAYKGE
jgi:flagellar biosynthesis/type III secretory pathway protein FliH